jgi:pyridoxine 4-dehydrogenase
MHQHGLSACRLSTLIFLSALIASSSLLPQQPSKLAVPSVGRIKAGPLTLSELGCGTWSWGNRLLFGYDPSQDEDIYQAYRIVRRAGVTLFDTADSYGTLDLNGRAEILLGEFERRFQLEEEASGTPPSSPSNPFSFLTFGTNQKRAPTNNRQQVATKFAPYPWRITSKSMLTAAKESLERLQQPKLAIAQLHWSTANYQPFQEVALWEGLADIYDAGLCEAVGVSNYGPKQLQKIAARMEERNVPLVTAQIQYSLMTYKACRDMNDVCETVGCQLISYSPLCLGLLTGKYTLDNLPQANGIFGFSPRRQLFRELLPGAQDLLRVLEAVGMEYDKSQSQVAINWARQKNTIPIPGCRTVQQATSNLESVAGWKLSADAMDELDRAALAVKKPMIQNVFQTN